MASYNLRSRSLALLWALTLVPVALCACYAPNGTVTTFDDFFACPQPDTICCALGRTNPAGADKADGATKDECLPNGLCENRYLEDGKPVQTWWRTFCTDQGFSAEKCVDACTTGDAVEKFGNRRMTPCDGTRNSEKWCCGESRDCCTPDDNPDAIVLAATLGASTSTSALSSSIPASSVSSGQPTITSSTVPTSTGGGSVEDSSLSSGAKAGIGVGAGVGAVALLGIGAFFVAKSRRQNRPKGAVIETDGNEIAPGEPPKYQYQQFNTSAQPTPVAELPGAMAQHELPAAKYDQHHS